MKRKFDAASLYVSASNILSRFQSKKTAKFTIMNMVRYSTPASANDSCGSMPVLVVPLTRFSSVAMKKSNKFFPVRCFKDEFPVRGELPLLEDVRALYLHAS